MRKQIIPYILSAACLLSACSADYFSEPDQVTSPADSNMLSLTVSASDGLSSRSTEEGGVTTFNTGDCVGLIVLDSEGHFFANNIPYIYDSDSEAWKFHVDNTEGKQPVYYDAEMSTYIVYYPYTETADNCKSLDAIVGLPIFEYQTNQSSEETYRKADVLVWEDSVNLRSIDATMWHAHDSFSLNTKIKWTLVPLGKKNEEGEKEDAVLEYLPLRETLKDFSIVYKIEGEDEIVLLNDKIDRTYHDNDSSYRYLLPPKQKGTIEWQYTYRNITFRGTQNIDATPTGKRYLNNEFADMGDLPGGNMQISDFYCRKDTVVDGDTIKIGYVFP